MKGPFCEISVMFGSDDGYRISAIYDVAKPGETIIHFEELEGSSWGRLHYAGQTPEEMLHFFGPIDNGVNDELFLEAAAKLLAEL